MMMIIIDPSSLCCCLVQLNDCMSSYQLVEVENAGSFNVCICYNDTMFDGNYTITIDVSGQAKEDLYIPASLNITEDTDSPACVEGLIKDDMLIEPNQSAVISFNSSDTNFIFSPSNVTITILDNDGILQLTVNTSVDVSYGNPFLVCAEANTRDHELSFTIQASSGPNILTPSSLQATFNGSSHCFEFTANNTSVIGRGERTELINWSLSGSDQVQLVSSTTTVNIASQLVLSLTNDTNVNVSEAVGIISLCVTSNYPAGPSAVAVGYAITGITPMTGQVELANGQSQICLSVSIRDNNIVGDSESFTVTFSSDIPFSSSSIYMVSVMDNDFANVSVNESVTVDFNNLQDLTICASVDNNVIFAQSVSLQPEIVGQGQATMLINAVMVPVPGCSTVPNRMLLSFGTSLTSSYIIKWFPIPANFTDKVTITSNTTATIIIRLSSSTPSSSPSSSPSPSPSTPIYPPSSPSSSVSTITDSFFSSSSASPSPSSTLTPVVFPPLAIVGIIVGVVVVGLLLLLVLVCVIACVKIKTNRQGYYATQEDKEDQPQMIRYSASLRSLQSQTILPVGPRDKENEYMI
jgi:hypothetical protein